LCSFHTFNEILNINKLLLLRRKNRPEMKASFLFDILGTIILKIIKVGIQVQVAPNYFSL